MVSKKIPDEQDVIGCRATEELLNCLGEDDRKLFILHYREKKSIREISKLMVAKDYGYGEVILDCDYWQQRKRFACVQLRKKIRFEAKLQREHTYYFRSLFAALNYLLLFDKCLKDAAKFCFKYYLDSKEIKFDKKLLSADINTKRLMDETWRLKTLKVYPQFKITTIIDLIVKSIYEQEQSEFKFHLLSKEKTHILIDSISEIVEQS